MSDGLTYTYRNKIDKFSDCDICKKKKPVCNKCEKLIKGKVHCRKDGYHKCSGCWVGEF